MDTQNTFYHGDCLFVMKHDIAPGTIDLIYLDPPFFTGKIQKGKWKPEAMEVSYQDSKRFWKEKGIASHAPEWLKYIAVERPDFASYIFYIRERLNACKSVLKKTGSIYLHCDWRASSYLRMVMDEIFGYKNFQNEIIWKYTVGGKGKARFARKHDVIFFYTKTDDYYFDGKAVAVPRKTGKTSSGGIMGTDEDGRPYQDKLAKGGKYYRYYLDEGKIPEDVWAIESIQSQSKERSGYPTQKPQALLERIIKASSKDNDIVLDPFCGCGTTVIMASKLNRRFIGIDIDTSKRTKGKLPTAFNVIKRGSHELFNQAKYVSRDITEVLEMNPLQFEDWVNEYYKADKPHPDRGIDGVTQDGVPIQVKTFQVTYKTISQFVTDVKYHANVPKPIKKVIIASQIGFDDGARRRKFEIETAEDITIELATPQDMLTLET